MQLELTKAQRLLIIISISFSFFLAEIGVGFYTKSLAVVADAFHYLNDLVGFIVAFVALKISERSNSPKALSFGWQRANLLGAFFNGVFLWALGVSIFLQSIERFVSLQRVENPKLVLIIGCVGFALNVISAIFLHEHDEDVKVATDGHVPMENFNQASTNTAQEHTTHRHEVPSTDKREGKEHDLGMMGVLLHVISDAANNVGVIIAATVIWKAKYASRYYADPAVGMAIAFMIFISSIPLVKRTGAILLQTVPRGVDPDDVKHDLETIAGILAVHELHIWRLNQQKAIASAHVVIANAQMTDFMSLASTINECFHAYGIHSATIQPEFLPAAAAPQHTIGIVDGGTEQIELAPLPASSVQTSRADNSSIEEGPGLTTLRRRAVGDGLCILGCKASVCESENLTCCT